MKRLFLLLLTLSLVFSIVGCSEATSSNTTVTTITTTAPKSTTQPTTTETTAPQILTYPFNVKDKYLSYAVSVPQIIYTTTGAENGLAGNIYFIEGTLDHIDTYTDETGIFTYRDAIVRTDIGTVMISNMFESIYNASVHEYGESATKDFYTDNVADYVFPSEGERAKFICIYIGYSVSKNQPVFYMGASSDLFTIAGLADPTAVTTENHSTTPVTDHTETTPPPQTTETEPPKQEEPEETEPPKQDPPEETTPPTQSGPSAGESNALSSAKDYLQLMSFSYNGLIDQLEYEGYTHAEATYAADNCGADWNEQAVIEAKNYIDLMPFSYTGLVEQLEYDQYTRAQAEYGANNCGADWYEQAARAAANYLNIMSFSREGLIEQLEYDGFTHDQAVYGVEQNGL